MIMRNRNFEKFELSPINPPCQNCNDRHMKCHSTCKDYKAFIKENNKMRHERHMRLSIYDTLYGNVLGRSYSLKNNGTNLKHGRRGGMIAQGNNLLREGEAGSR